MKKTRLKKIKWKRIFAFSAVFIVLFAFLVIPAGATSSIIYSSSEGSQNVHSMSVPVPIDIYFDVVRAEASESGGRVETWYGFSSSLSSIAYLNEFSSSYNVSTRDNLPSNYVWSGIVSPVSSSLEFFDLYPDRDDDSAFIGTCTFYYSGFKFSNSLDVTDGLPNSRSPGTDVHLSLSDFYMWNKTFPRRFFTNSEISLVFSYETTHLRPSYFDFYYSFAGDPTVNYLRVYADDFDTSENTSFGVFVFSPSVLGIDDPEAVVYVHSCDIQMRNRSLVDASTFLPYVIFDISAEYTFNPFLDNYSVSVPDDTDDPDVPVPPVDPDNPAIALSRYTEWIGDALGGFLDFNIFPGFTLGGIFMTLLAFSCVVWFLKLVAGG